MESSNFEQDIQQKYAGLSYEELIETVQKENMSNLVFIIAQKKLFQEFKDFLSDRGMDSYDEETAVLFLEEKEIRMMNLMEDESIFLLEGLL